MSTEIYLNEENEIVNESKNFVIIRSNYSYISSKVVYSKDSDIYISSLNQKQWSEISSGGSCLSIWAKKDRGKYNKFDLIISHQIDGIIKNFKVASPSLPRELPEDIKDEILLSKV